MVGLRYLYSVISWALLCSLALIGWFVALARLSLVDQLRCWLAVLTARCELVGSKRVEENGEEFF